MWFRELRPCLFSGLSSPIIDQLVMVGSRASASASSSSSAAECFLEYLRQAMVAGEQGKGMGEEKFGIFLWLLDLLCEVARNKTFNLMSLHNLAIVVAPNLFNPDSMVAGVGGGGGEGKRKTINPVLAMMMSSKVVELVKHALTERMKGYDDESCQ